MEKDVLARSGVGENYMGVFPRGTENGDMPETALRKTKIHVKNITNTHTNAQNHSLLFVAAMINTTGLVRLLPRHVRRMKRKHYRSEQRVSDENTKRALALFFAGPITVCRNKAVKNLLHYMRFEPCHNTTIFPSPIEWVHTAALSKFSRRRALHSATGFIHARQQHFETNTDSLFRTTKAFSAAFTMS